VCKRAGAPVCVCGSVCMCLVVCVRCMGGWVKCMGRVGLMVVLGFGGVGVSGIAT